MQPATDALRAFVAACARVRAGAALAAACARARDVPPDDASARDFFESAFTPYAITASSGAQSGLITGYYEPVLRGSPTRNETFRYPVFGVPPDMIVVDLAGLYPDLKHRRLRGRVEGRRLVPYYSRAEIERDDSRFDAPVLAWVSDPVALFFLQIQGSGRIAFDDGSQLRLGYADQNGHPYRSLGRHLVERGELPLEEASMQGIQAWGAAHPEKLRAALDANPSYVFFRELPTLAAQAGPIGALGVPLHARASLAVDRRFIPLGAPLYLATTLPLSDAPLEQLAVALDTGGAIRGPVRADYYWGSGPEAGAIAGRMRQQGRLWLLWPRGVPLPRN
ncbi:MAG: transglycosylase [Betaproteobacteria bacterium SG8_39]|nr:MAG: transglycosylase [Betaproteobacteria bacterium SG8_39]